MGKSSKKSTVGFQYKFGMHALLGLAPISRIVRVFTDNQDLITTPTTGGEVAVSAPTIYQGGEISDGVAGKLRFHLNGAPSFDAYLLAEYGIDPSLVPRFDAVAHVVFSGTRTVQGYDATDLNSYWESLGLEPPTVGDPIEAGAGPFYFGNSPYPRDFLFIAERTATTCPFAEFALLPYTHEDWGIVCNDFNPLVMYWELFIKDDPDSYGSTWAAAAETVFDEGIGVYFNSAGGDLEAIEREIERYVNGRVYIDRQSGLKEIELIRPDFDVAELVTIGETDLIGEPDLVFPDRSLFANTFDCTFRDRRKKFDDGAFVVQDGAHVASYGPSRQAADYTWITNRELATTLALRDLAPITGAGLSGTIRVSGLRPDLHNGSPFVLNLPSYDVSTVVCRIASIKERGLRDNSVEIALIQDVFGVEIGAIVNDDLPGTETTAAIPATNQLALELPYYLGLLIGGDDYIAESAANEAFGSFGLAIERPNSRHIGFMIAVDTGSGYVARGEGEFVTRGVLQGDLTRTSTTIVVSPLYGIDVDSVLMIGSEFVRIDAIDISAGTTWELEVGRGCIDTAPTPHVAGEIVWRIFDAATDRLSYLDGETIDVVAMTKTTSSIINAGDATPLSITFASRAIRPYPPGQFAADASYDDDIEALALFYSDSVVLTWVGRNRLLQTDESFIEDHFDGAISPEGGTTYRVEVQGYDGDMISVGAPETIDVGTATTYTTSGGDFPGGTVFAKISVFAVRDGRDSWTAPAITRLYVGGFEEMESGEPLLTESGEFIEIE